MAIPEINDLAYAYGSFAGTHTLIELFASGLPELELEFSPEDFIAFYDDFRERESSADITDSVEQEFYWIKGKECWIRVCFEAHESYYGWRCYTAKHNATIFRAYFKSKGFKDQYS